ncbi:MAG: PAS domain S-box protein [Anaerolineales bacterium]|nr:PAS domain S-box protein [Anaerolineales bacterium]
MSLTPSGTSPLNPLRALLPGRNLEARFQHTLEQMPGAALVVVPRTGQFLALNGRVTALTGWTRDEFLARSLAEVFPAPDTLAHFYSLEPGNSKTLNGASLRTRFGQQQAVDVRLSALREGHDVVVLVLAAASDERLGQERERARLAHMLTELARLPELFEAASPESIQTALENAAELLFADAAGVFRSPPDQASLDLEHRLNFPPGFPQLIGPSEAHWLQIPYIWSSTQRGEGVLPQAFRAAGWSHVLAYPLGQAPKISGALLLAYRPGNPPPAAAPAFLAATAHQFAHLLAEIERASRLQDAQRLATRVAQKLDAITAQVTDGIVTINSSGQVEEMSRAGTRLFGYRPEDVIGLRFEEVLCADELLTQAIRDGLASGPSRGLRRDGHMHRRDGERFPVSVRLQPLPSAGAGCILVVRDLTRERADESQRQQVDHLAYVGQSLQAFAHEVRAPLNNISMGVQFLAARLPAGDELQPALAKIQAEAARLSALMNDMLSWAKPVQPHLAPVDLSGVLRRVLGRWSAKLQQRNITSALTAPEALPAVLADPFLVERVFINLIENALQAMPAGGHLALSVSAADRPPQGRVLEAKVIDSGPGIPEEARRRVFDPYFTTKADGTGLGLAISKRIVTVHRGAIACESFAGVGTIFTVTLPAHDPAAPAQEPVE